MTFTLACGLVGATLIVTSSTLFRPIRRFWSTLRCSQCVGMWVGALAGASGVASLGHGRILDALIVGAATSFLAQLADAALTLALGEPNEKP